MIFIQALLERKRFRSSRTNEVLLLTFFLDMYLDGGFEKVHLSNVLFTYSMIVYFKTDCHPSRKKKRLKNDVSDDEVHSLNIQFCGGNCVAIRFLNFIIFVINNNVFESYLLHFTAFEIQY